MLINLTPHDLNFLDANNSPIMTLKKSGHYPTVRVKKESTSMGSLTESGVEIPLYRSHFSMVENLPEEKPDTIYVVSNIALSAIREQHPHRTDFLAPDDAVRNADGVIIGCRILTSM